MWFPGAKHTVESVARQLVEGLENESLFLREADRPRDGGNPPLPVGEAPNGDAQATLEELQAARERMQRRADEWQRRTSWLCLVAAESDSAQLRARPEEARQSSVLTSMTPK